MVSVVRQFVGIVVPKTLYWTVVSAGCPGIVPSRTRPLPDISTSFAVFQSPSVVYRM